MNRDKKMSKNEKAVVLGVTLILMIFYGLAISNDKKGEFLEGYLFNKVLFGNSTPIPVKETPSLPVILVKESPLPIPAPEENVVTVDDFQRYTLNYFE